MQGQFEAAQLVHALTSWTASYHKCRVENGRNPRHAWLFAMFYSHVYPGCTDELGHLEIVGTIIHQLTRNLTCEQIKACGFDTYFVDHTAGVYPVAASGAPWSANTISVTGDTIADLTEDLAAEQKARVTYDNILRLSYDPDVDDVIQFLREREVVHFQRFGEGLRLAKERMEQKNFYFMNPSFDR